MIINPNTILYLFLLTRWASSSPYNHKGHSYFVSAQKRTKFEINCECTNSGHYWLTIEDKEENKFIISIMKDKTFLGYFKVGKKFRSYNDLKGPYRDISEEMVDDKANTQLAIVDTGEWVVVDETLRGFYICENDKLSPNGINTTNFFNVPPTHKLLYLRHSYFVFPAKRSYRSVQSICDHLYKGYPFIPNDAEEMCAISGFLAGDTLLGLQNGETTGYFPLKRKSAGNCVVYSHMLMGFVTQACSDPEYFVCEINTIRPSLPVECQIFSQPNFPTTTFAFNMQKYNLYDFMTTETNAEKICKSNNQNLYVPSSHVENCLVMNKIDPPILLAKKSNELTDSLIIGSGGNYCIYADSATDKLSISMCRETSFVCTSKIKSTHRYNKCRGKFIDARPGVDHKYGVGDSVVTLFSQRLNYYDTKKFCFQLDYFFPQDNNFWEIREFSQKSRLDVLTTYQVVWDSLDWNWYGSVPSVNITWLPGEPKFKNERISCVIITPENFAMTGSCFEKRRAFCLKKGRLGQKKRYELYGGIAAAIVFVAATIFLFKIHNRKRKMVFPKITYIKNNYYKNKRSKLVLDL